MRLLINELGPAPFDWVSYHETPKRHFVKDARKKHLAVALLATRELARFRRERDDQCHGRVLSFSSIKLRDVNKETVLL